MSDILIGFLIGAPVWGSCGAGVIAMFRMRPRHRVRLDEQDARTTHSLDEIVNSFGMAEVRPNSPVMHSFTRGERAWP